MNCDILKEYYNMLCYFQWAQITGVFPRSWKDIIKQNTNNVDKLLTHNYHIIKGSGILAVIRLTYRELYSYLTSTIKVKSSSNMYFDNFSRIMTLTGRPSTCYHQRLRIIFTVISV